MEVSSFVLLYFGTKIFVRCLEVSVVQRRPLMEVPLYRLHGKKILAYIFFLKLM